MTVTLSNLIGIGILIAIIIAGKISRKISSKKVDDLDGFSGCVKSGKKSKRGSIISTL